MSKRKRSPSIYSSRASSQQPLPHDTINPLSHNETTIKQLHVAGLTENDLLPATYIPGFPHRPIRPSPLLQSADHDESDEHSDARQSDKDDASTQKQRRRRQQAARRGRDAQEQHVGVLTAVVLRSLDQNDIPRAKRAFGLLWRTQVRGQPVDLRRQGLWTLGAEVLMRDGETTAATPRRRWGATGNMPQLRAYLACLIRQYPYNRLHPTAISDLDFYPVLFGCEVYDVWVEHKLGWERLEMDAETWSDEFEMNDDDSSSSFEDQLRLPFRERRLREEKARRHVQALATVRGLAARMDALMENAPYNRSVEMLRLRGMVALFVGDLSMPPSPRTADEEEESKPVREEERAKAKVFFIKMRNHGGRVDGRIQRWMQDEDDDDAYGQDEDSEDGMFSSLPVFSSLPIR